jgi:hypothetical protein
MRVKETGTNWRRSLAARPGIARVSAPQNDADEETDTKRNADGGQGIALGGVLDRRHGLHHRILGALGLMAARPRDGTAEIFYVLTEGPKMLGDCLDFLGQRMMGRHFSVLGSHVRLLDLLSTIGGP